MKFLALTNGANVDVQMSNRASERCYYLLDEHTATPVGNGYDSDDVDDAGVDAAEEVADKTNELIWEICKRTKKLTT